VKINKKTQFQSDFNKTDFLKENRLIFVIPVIKSQEETVGSPSESNFDTLVHKLANEIQKKHGGPIDLAERTAEAELRLAESEREKLNLAMAAKTAQEKAKFSEQMAHTDKLTGLSNRTAYMHKIRNDINRFERTGEPVSLIMIDIDHFKSYNDKYGHKTGDEVLRLVSQILKDNIPRKTDMVARYGGEEFIGAFPNTDRRGVALVAEKLRTAIEEGTRGKAFPPVTISLGYATLDKDNEEFRSIEKLELAADTALYHSKNNGRNHSTEYKKGLKMPSQLEKLAKKLFYLQHELERVQDDLSNETKIVELVEKSDDKDLILYMSTKITGLEEKISKLRAEIRNVEEAADAERARAVA